MSVRVRPPAPPPNKNAGRPCAGRGPSLCRAARRRSRERRCMCQPPHPDEAEIWPLPPQERRRVGRVAGGSQIPSLLRRQGPVSVSCCAALVTGAAAHVSATAPGRSRDRPLPPQGRRRVGRVAGGSQIRSLLRRQGPMSVSCCAAAVTGTAVHVSATPPRRSRDRPPPPQGRRRPGRPPAQSPPSSRAPASSSPCPESAARNQLQRIKKSPDPPARTHRAASRSAGSLPLRPPRRPRNAPPDRARRAAPPR